MLALAAHILRLDNTEEWIRELEEKVTEITQAKQKHIVKMSTVYKISEAASSVLTFAW